MSATTEVKLNNLRGGEFIIKDSKPEDIFIPEEMNEDQRMITEMVNDFVSKEVWPNIDKLEKQQDNLNVRLMDKAAALGLLGTHMPEQYGGMALDTNTNTLITDKLGTMTVGFTVSIAAHVGIGMLPILYFGNDEQKEQYLPGLIDGTLKASYCLTEPSSGSDALAAKTEARLTDDGNFYILNGQKMWISNAGFANLLIVFAQVDGKKFTGFIVDAKTKGITLGAEEDKLGIKASSTRQVFFENVKVPVENTLGEVGRGHLIAFNALNIGRFKLAAMSLGGAKVGATSSVKYANERHQFKQPIANFGAIKYKLAEQAIRIYSVESAQYRASESLQRKKQELMAAGHDFAEAQLMAAEEYAIECALLKVAGSEALDYVVDENVQIHGGIGFSEEYSAARAYRDARINRIYEGTNEINRLLSVDMLLRRAMKGQLDLIGPAWAVQKELASMPSMERATGLYADEHKAVTDLKKIILMVAGGAAKMQMDGEINLKEEQEILMNVADMMIDVYVAESLLLRVIKLHDVADRPVSDIAVYEAMLKVTMHDANAKVHKSATDALGSFAEGDLLRTFMMGLKRFSKYPPQNVKKLRRLVADTIIKANKYPFDVT